MRVTRRVSVKRARTLIASAGVLLPALLLPVTASAAPYVTEYSYTGGAAVGITSASDGNMYFTQGPNQSVSRITTTGVATPMYTLPGTGGAFSLAGITENPNNGKIFIANNANGDLEIASKVSGSYTAGSGLTTVNLGSSPTPDPVDITIGSDNLIYVTDRNNHRILKIDPNDYNDTNDDVITPISVVVASSTPAPFNIATGADGNVWFTQVGNNKIGRLTTGGAHTQYDVTTPSAFVAGIVKGGDGNMWFTMRDVDKIGKITPDGQITEYSLPAGVDHPTGIEAVGNDIWVAATSSSQLVRVSTADPSVMKAFSVDSTPGNLTLGSDGNIWYLGANNKVGKFDLAALAAAEAVVAAPGSPNTGLASVTSNPIATLALTSAAAFTMLMIARRMKNPA